MFVALRPDALVETTLMLLFITGAHETAEILQRGAEN